MRRPSVCWIAVSCGLAVFIAPGQRGSAQQAPPAPQPSAVTPRAELYPRLEDAFLRWPLPAGAERYAAIDGKRMHRDVVEQALISRRYRDQVHPKFWGRITGTSSDHESAEWLAAKFKGAGLSDVQNPAAGSRTAMDAADLGCGRDRRWQDVRLERAQPLLRRQRPARRRSRRRSRVRRARERGRFRREGRAAARRCSCSTRPD